MPAIVVDTSSTEASDDMDKSVLDNDGGFENAGDSPTPTQPIQSSDSNDTNPGDKQKEKKQM